jgi:hypothetical protein
MQLFDRVKQVTTTTGTGTLTLGSAVTGFKTFGDYTGSTAVTIACVFAVDENNAPTGQWEVFSGTYTHGGTTLSRTSLLSSSTGSAVNFSAGTKHVVCCIDASVLSVFAEAVMSNGITATEIGYLDGVTSDIQTQIDGKVNTSTFTTKGDILVATGSGTYSALPVGTNDKVLTAASGEATGLKWETPSGGGSLPSIMAVLGFTGGKFVAEGVYGATGTPIDLYTVPAGKRCFIAGSHVYNNSGGTITGSFGWQVYVNGAYYVIGTPSVNPINNSNTGGIVKGIVLEAGEKIAFNASASGISARFRGIEFDDTVRFYSPRLYTVTSGQNTLYTCPSGYNATHFNPFRTNNSNDIEPYAGYQSSGGNVSYQPHIVPSGGTPETTNSVGAATTFSNNIVNGPSTYSLYLAYNSGDFLSISSNSSHASQWLWSLVLEVPN